MDVCIFNFEQPALIGAHFFEPLGAYYISVFSKPLHGTLVFFQCHNALTNLSKKQIPPISHRLICRDLYRRFILILIPAGYNLAKEIKCLRSMGNCEP